MYIKITAFLLLLEVIDITYASTSRANELIQNICDTLYNDKSSSFSEDQQWEIICQELFYSKDNVLHRREQRDITSVNVEEQEDVAPQKAMYKAPVRIGIRTGSSIRTGGSLIRTGSGIRSTPSSTRYQNTRTGQSYRRPSGSYWSRSALIFLPISTRYFHRSRSSSNRYTTSSTGSQTYYYCTSGSDPSLEIQCSTADGDQKCCEDENTNDPFCCSDTLPDDLSLDPNRATRTIATIFYTLAALTLCMHLFMRRIYR